MKPKFWSKVSFRNLTKMSILRLGGIEFDLLHITFFNMTGSLIIIYFKDICS